MTEHRIRESVFIDRATGDATVRRELLAGGDWTERIAGLKALVADAGPGLRVLRVSCNDCGGIRDLDWDAPELPPGWSTTRDGEFCPGCTGERDGEG